MSSNREVKCVPQNAYGPVRSGQTVMTHGVEVGMMRAESSDLRSATRAIIEGLVRGNPDMGVSGQRASRLSTRTAMRTSLEGRSPLRGVERVTVYAALLADGNLIYFVTVVPERDREAYMTAFDRVYQSLRVTDGS